MTDKKTCIYFSSEDFATIHAVMHTFGIQIRRFAEEEVSELRDRSLQMADDLQRIQDDMLRQQSVGWSLKG